MAELIKKQHVDVGEIGNASTGDILYDGGVKINENFSALFNAFGDQRYFSANEGENLQVIHATGYFQRGTAQIITDVIPNGSQYDIDTSGGGFAVRLSKGKQGEMVRFINSNGSISVNKALTIVPNDSFRGVSGNLRVTSPYSIITCICISDSNGTSVWDYSIQSLFGDTVASIRQTYELSTNNTVIPICHKSEFNTVKLLLTAASNNNSKMKSSEVTLLIDALNNKVYSTEFASLIVGGTDDEDEIYKCEFSIASSGFVNATVSSPTSGMKLAIKSTHTQKIGVAQ